MRGHRGARTPQASPRNPSSGPRLACTRPQIPKLDVAGSTPVARSREFEQLAPLALQAARRRWQFGGTWFREDSLHQDDGASRRAGLRRRCRARSLRRDRTGGGLPCRGRIAGAARDQRPTGRSQGQSSTGSTLGGARGSVSHRFGCLAVLHRKRTSGAQGPCNYFSPTACVRPNLRHQVPCGAARGRARRSAAWSG